MRKIITFGEEVSHTACERGFSLFLFPLFFVDSPALVYVRNLSLLPFYDVSASWTAFPSLLFFHLPPPPFFLSLAVGGSMKKNPGRGYFCFEPRRIVGLFSNINSIFVYSTYPRSFMRRIGCLSVCLYIFLTLKGNPQFRIQSNSL